MNIQSYLLILISFTVKLLSGSNTTCGLRMVQQSDQSNTNRRFKRIVNGEHSYHGQWPWIVSLKNPTLKELLQKHTPKYMNWSLVGSDSHICGGTLISSQWIVTAKHCLYYNFSPQSSPVLFNWSATMGAYNISGTSSHSMTMSVDKVFFQEGWFGPDLDDNDIAIMHLENPVNYSLYISPACLPSKYLGNPGSVCYAVGWGTAYSLNDTVVNPILKHATLRIMERQESKACVTQTSKEICTSPVSGSVCRGDSGGPLLCQGSQNDWVFIGVTVRGSGCQKFTDRSIFTSVYDHMDFISRIINSGTDHRAFADCCLRFLYAISVIMLVFRL